MHPIEQQSHVEHRIAALRDEAHRERLAATQRRQHVGEHLVHPSLSHRHAATGMRGAVGRMLIGIGTAIAGTGPEAGAGRAA